MALCRNEEVQVPLEMMVGIILSPIALIVVLRWNRIFPKPDPGPKLQGTVFGRLDPNTGQVTELNRDQIRNL